jgi:cold shock CspA family protein
MQGTIKTVERSFLFVRPDAGGSDVFVHKTACPQVFADLAPGDRLEFDEVDSPKFPGKTCAANVRVLGGAA